MNAVRQRRLFCDLNPVCYAISMKKENIKRYIADLLGGECFASELLCEPLPNMVSSHRSKLIKTGPGIDPELQYNKAINIELACAGINGIVVRPGEFFSFWHLVGKTTEKKGYRNGRVIVDKKLVPGLGGGLCNLGHSIHRVVLHSPLEVTEFHSHSDALAPDEGKRVPFSCGTSVCFNHKDLRFRNNTDQDVQILVYCKKGMLYSELRSEREFPWTYCLTEEGLHYRMEGGRYFRCSKIYRNTTDRRTGKITDRRLVLDNHSEVMFDYSLIPPGQITGTGGSAEI